jgi:hypothetical protein
MGVGHGRRAGNVDPGRADARNSGVRALSSRPELAPSATVSVRLPPTQTLTVRPGRSMARMISVRTLTGTVATGRVRLAAPPGRTDTLVLSFRTSRSAPPFRRSRVKRDAVAAAMVWVDVAAVRTLAARVYFPVLVPKVVGALWGWNHGPPVAVVKVAGAGSVLAMPAARGIGSMAMPSTPAMPMTAMGRFCHSVSNSSDRKLAAPALPEAPPSPYWITSA